jgi:hypothetical protein
VSVAFRLSRAHRSQRPKANNKSFTKVVERNMLHLEQLQLDPEVIQQAVDHDFLRRSANSHFDQRPIREVGELRLRLEPCLCCSAFRRGRRVSRGTRLPPRRRIAATTAGPRERCCVFCPTRSDCRDRSSRFCHRPRICIRAFPGPLPRSSCTSPRRPVPAAHTQRASSH